MSAIARTKVKEGENALIAARVRYANETRPLLAELTSIQLKIFDLSGEDVRDVIWEKSLDPVEHFSDVDIEDGWAGVGGYNFSVHIPGGKFTVEGGHTYRAQAELKFGAAEIPQSIFVIAEVEVEVVW